MASRRSETAAIAMSAPSATTRPRPDAAGAGAFVAVHTLSRQSSAGAHCEVSVQAPPSGTRVLVGAAVTVAVRVSLGVTVGIVGVTDGLGT